MSDANKSRKGFMSDFNTKKDTVVVLFFVLKKKSSSSIHLENKMKMKVLACLFLLKVSVQANHFRGGYISWQPASPTRINVSTLSIIIQQTYS